MLVWISWFFLNMIYAVFDIKLYETILSKKVKYDLKYIAYILSYSIVNVLAIIILGEKYKMVLTIIFAILFLYLIFKDDLILTTFVFFIILIILSLSEMVCYFLGNLLLNADMNFFMQNSIGVFISNCFILLTTYFIITSKPILNILKNIIKWNSKNKYLSTFIFMILALYIVTFFLYQNFSSNISIWYILFTLIFMISIVVFIIGYFNEKARNNRLKYKYDELHNYAMTYETELAEKSKAQHEYRNQLIIVKNLIDSDTKEASLYIEKILKKDLNSKNLYWLNKLINIPYGGLKGLLYYKIMEMVNKKFEIYINISEELRKKSLWKIYEENAQDITRIIGVYIDNAIEAASISEDKFFILDVLYENNNIEFVFSNTYTNDIDINKIDKEGYTSKGKGRGYGLSLVKDILDNNSNLSQEREINGKFYVQKLIIRTK